MRKLLLIILASIAFSLSTNVYAVVELNKATQEELESLQGVGPIRAKSIIEYRETHGGFKSVDELGNVSGIGKATLDSIRKDISVWEPYWEKDK